MKNLHTSPSPDPVSELIADCDAARSMGDPTPLPPALDGQPPDSGPARGSAPDSWELADELSSWDDPSTVPEFRADGDAPFEVPERVGRFEVRGVLGRGSFGVVYLAFDPRLGRHVALKVPRSDLLPTHEVRRRFPVEARAAAKLDHPNLVAVYESGEAGGLAYLASAYCPGPNLAQWARAHGRPAPPRDAAALVAVLAAALAHAHARGVLHRDLKPANVLLTSTEPLPGPRAPLTAFVPKVADFGLAKLLGCSPSATRTGELLGTPRYMAPEQADGRIREVGPPADVYSLGVILYELLTGRHAVGGSTALEVLDRLRSEEPAPPSLLADVPPALEAICLRCLRKQPGRRYPTAAALAADLNRWLSGRRPAWPGWSGGFRRWWSAGHGPLLAGGAALACLAWLAPAPAAVPRPRAVEVRPETDLAAALRALERREPVTVVGPDGGPRFGRSRNENGVTTLALAGQPFRLGSPHNGALELVPNVPCAAYRFRSDVRQCGESGLAGIFFRAADGSEAGREEMRYCAVTFGPYTHVPRCVQVQLVRYPRIGDRYPTEQLEWFDLPAAATPEESWGGAGAAAAAVAAAGVPLPGPARASHLWPTLGLFPDHSWHTLAAEVTPDGWSVTWDGREVFRTTAAAEREALARWWKGRKDRGEPAGPPPLLGPNGALGLLVYGTEAKFRNVVVEPLP